MGSGKNQYQTKGGTAQSQYQQKITSIRQERAGMKNELAELIGGIES